MQVTFKKQPKNLLEITVELSAAELDPFIKKAAVRISESTEIPGFRKGLAPFEMVKNKVGEMALYQEGAALAIDQTLERAVDDQKVYILGQPQIRVDKLAPGNPFIYTATVSLLPEVEVTDLSKIQVTRQAVTVSEEEVERVINDLRQIRASEVLTDKAAEKGDLVEVDFEVLKDKVVVDGGLGKKYPLVIGKNQMIPGFEDQVVSLKKDQTKEFKLTFPADYPNKNLAGQSGDFKVKVLGVYQRTLPEVNDDFVKMFGQFKDLVEFKKAVRTNIEADLKLKEENRLELEMLEKIFQTSKFGEIPDVLVNAETRKMIDELKESVQSRGLKFEDYLQHLKKKADDLLIDFAPEALKRVKFALLIRKIGEQEKVSVSSEQIDSELKLYQERYKRDENAQKSILTPGFRGYVGNLLKNRKTIEFLKSKIVK